MSFVPESWELPSHVAGDVRRMDDWRINRVTEPVDDPQEGPGALLKFGPRGQRQMPAPGSSSSPLEQWASPPASVPPVEPYHPPAEMYENRDLDALTNARFQPIEAGVWQRPFANNAGEHGGVHTMVYEPGHRRSGDGKLAPWHFMSDPEEPGTAFESLRGPQGALAASDAAAEQFRTRPNLPPELPKPKQQVRYRRNRGDLHVVTKTGAELSPQEQTDRDLEFENQDTIVDPGHETVTPWVPAVNHTRQLDREQFPKMRRAPRAHLRPITEWADGIPIPRMARSWEESE